MKDEAGFTLVETLVALTLLAGIAASVASVFQLYGSRAALEERSLHRILAAREQLMDADVDASAGIEGRRTTRRIGPDKGTGGTVVEVEIPGDPPTRLSTIRLSTGK